MATLADQIVTAYARMKGDPQDQSDHLSLAVGILMGGGWPASAAAVILAWEALDPDGPRPDMVEEIVRRGQVLHEAGGMIDHFSELKDFAETHPGVKIDLDDEIPF